MHPHTHTRIHSDSYTNLSNIDIEVAVSTCHKEIVTMSLSRTDTVAAKLAVAIYLTFTDMGVSLKLRFANFGWKCKAPTEFTVIFQQATVLSKEAMCTSIIPLIRKWSCRKFSCF